jgi:hypothetical protein
MNPTFDNNEMAMVSQEVESMIEGLNRPVSSAIGYP